MRSHLDRHLQDPERRRERLRRIVAELPKKLSSNDLLSWWVERIGLALGAESAAIYERGGGFSCVLGASALPPQPDAPTPPGSVQVALSEDRALWLMEVGELDEGSRALLTAMGETVGVMLESRRLFGP